jgi:HNH endonuclease
MGYSDDELNDIFDRTDGDCHICFSSLSFGNYGRLGQRGAWEVDHSNPRARGGTNRRNNLYAACIYCNRSKRHGHTRAARSRYGKTSAPLSVAKKEERRTQQMLVGAVLGFFVAHLLDLPLHLMVAVIFFGGWIGSQREPDPQRR